MVKNIFFLLDSILNLCEENYAGIERFVSDIQTVKMVTMWSADSGEALENYPIA